MKKYKFFWKSNSPFSNWFLMNFNYRNKTFSSSEQAIMYEKALLFDDLETANKIFNSSYPKEQKLLGRQVKNFNPQHWDAGKYAIVKDILAHKFTSFPEITHSLLEYKGYEFVEASPFDRIWGIGFSEENAMENIDRWGENLLGKILTELSYELSWNK